MSDFEKFVRLQGFNSDFERGSNGQYKSDLLHFMEKAFIHQQAKIDAIKNKLSDIYDASDENEEVAHLLDEIQELINESQPK